MEVIFNVFQSPGPNLIELGPFIIRWYGILIAISVLLGLNLSSRIANSRGLNNNLINDLMPLLVLTSVIGARIYYVIFEWRNYSGINFWNSLNFLGIKIPIPRALEIWGGGIAIHGALIAGTISVLIFCKLRKQAFWPVLDVLVPSVALGQAIGRWGNFFNNEAFGIPTRLPWKLYIPYIHRPEIYMGDKYFHPTFLYESIWNILVFTLLMGLLILESKKYIKIPSGSISCIYIVSYSFGRFFIEALRTDPLCISSLPPLCEGGIRMAQLISVLFGLTGCLRLWWIFRMSNG